MVQNLDTGVVEDRDFTNPAAGVSRQNDSQLRACRQVDGAGGAANADHRHRGGDGHGIGIGFGDIAADERENALNQGCLQGACFGRRIVDQFIQRNARVLGQGKRAVVDENNADRAFRAGFDKITLVKGIALLQGFLGAVGAGYLDRALDRFHLADGFGGSRVRTGLGDLARRGGSGHFRSEVAGNFCAVAA